VRQRARFHLVGVLFASCLLLLTVTACGISLGTTEDETETFKGLTVEGDFREGHVLKLVLQYAQPYPVEVAVECVLLEVDPESTATPEVTPTATNTPAKDATPTPVVIPGTRPAPKNKVMDILAQELPANPQDVEPAEATPVLGTIQKEFLAPRRPGRYIVRCLTPEDDNNAISKSITIAPASTPTP
jgi:hypothetical protein